MDAESLFEIFKKFSKEEKQKFINLIEKEFDKKKGFQLKQTKVKKNQKIKTAANIQRKIKKKPAKKPSNKNVDENIDMQNVIPQTGKVFYCEFEDSRSGLPCKKEFNSAQDYLNHKTNHQGDRPWFCEYQDCDYRAAQRNHLIGHVRKSHTGRYQFKCDWPGCGFRGCSRYNINRHRIIHTGEKPYKCDWPGCDFESPNNKLVTHKRIHTGERPYPCDWPGCEARFSRPFTLRNHKRTHTGEKPFVCDWPGCDYKSAQQTPLSNHKKKHQQELMQQEDATSSLSPSSLLPSNKTAKIKRSDSMQASTSYIIIENDGITFDEQEILTSAS